MVMKNPTTRVVEVDMSTMLIPTVAEEADGIKDVAAMDRIMGIAERTAPSTTQTNMDPRGTACGSLNLARLFLLSCWF